MGLKGLLLVVVFILLNSLASAELIFYESFDNNQSVADNKGTIYGNVGFVDGVLDKAINLSGTKKVCYPLSDNFDPSKGTIEFWIKDPPESSLGLFDIGRLMNPNSWGLIKNSNYLIMEVKNDFNSYDQAWSPNSWNYNTRWNHVAAVWEKEGNITYSKVFLDGSGKTEYDGIISDTYPNMSGEFCVGWNYWYGYSNSEFDEFKIYNNVKTDNEIKNDYLALVNNSRVNSTEKECSLWKPESKGSVKINCTGLEVNGEPFIARGVGYQPIPIGMTAGVAGGTDIIYNTPGIYERDFKLLREMNANTIRTWGKVTNRTFLDAAWNNGKDPLYVTMGFWINCMENYGSETIRQKYIDEFREYVREYKDHPAVLTWNLGNENNLDFCTASVYLDDLYILANDLAKVAYEEEGENYHPVGFVNGDFFNIGLSSYKADDDSVNYTDYWGSNIYPGYGFGYLLEDYASMTGKPLLITEYGIDALDNRNKKEYEDVHAEWTMKQLRDIEAFDRSLGSTVMAYSDEWWKSGSYSSHDYGGYVTDRHPDGYGNEEWWGVMRAKDDGSRVDIMEPRKLYYEFQKEWRNFEIDGDVNGDCKVDIQDLAKVGMCYGKTATGTCANADLDSDGSINIFDLATVGLNYGKSC